MISRQLCPASLLILGNSNVGWGIAQKGLELNYRVMITTRQKLDTFVKPKHIEYIHTPEEKIKDRQYWHDLTLKHVGKEKRLFVVNTIGGSIPSGKSTIEDLNINIPLAAIKGIWECVNDVKVVQFSTMAAAGLKAPYGATKREAEKQLMELPLNHLTIFRMGYVAEALIGNTVTHTYKNHHRLSLEEMTLLPFQFLIADPVHYNKVLVPIVSIADVSAAIFKAFNNPPQAKIIDAVNREIITQEQFSRFMTDLLGKKFRPYYIPVEAAAKLAQHHTFGHLVDYAIEYCAKEQHIQLNPEEFEKLVGRPLQTLRQMYRLKSDQKLIIPRPPVAAFSSHLLRNLWNKRESRLDTLRAIVMMAKSLHNRKKPFQPLDCPAPKAGYPWKTLSEEKFNQNSERNRRNIARSIQ